MDFHFMWTLKDGYPDRALNKMHVTSILDKHVRHVCKYYLNVLMKIKQWPDKPFPGNS